MSERRIVLVRHGETEWSRSGKHTSVSDVDLTAVGEQQARRVGAALAGRDFGLVLSSPRLRAAHTAELAGFPHYETDPRLVEWDYGVYEGRTTPEITDELGHDWTIWRAGRDGEPPAGESLAGVGARVDSVLERLEPVLRGGRDVLLFAHAHVLRVLAARWVGHPPADGAQLALGTGSISELGFEHGWHVIANWNLQPD